MDKNRKRDSELPTNTPSVVSPQDWETARQRLLVKEKTVMRARDALAAERRRMPWRRWRRRTSLMAQRAR